MKRSEYAQKRIFIRSNAQCFYENMTMRLLEWNKAGAVSSTDTWSTVLDWLVCQREVAQVMTDHFWLDFNLKEEKKVY